MKTPQQLKEQIQHLNDLGTALKMLAHREIIPEIIHHHERGKAGITLSFKDLKDVAGGQTVSKTVDTMIVYKFDWQGVELSCYQVKALQEPEQVKL